MKILVIEDDADTADYAVQGLREEGHSVDLESNGKAGLVRAIGGQYDGIEASTIRALLTRHIQTNL